MQLLWFIARCLNFLAYPITVIQLSVTTWVTTSLGIGVLSALLTLLVLKLFHGVMSMLVKNDTNPRGQ